MSDNSLTLLTAFGAGMLSFLSPCVLPLVPGYLSYLAGVSLEQAQSQHVLRWRVSLHALWFVLGCALVLTLLGGAASLLGSTLTMYQQLLERVGGLLLILFGIVMTGLLPIPWLSRTYHIQVKPSQSTWRRSAIIGLTFGASWSACTGPILASILVLTAVRSFSPLQGMIFLLTFAVGQGVPFLLVGLLVDRASSFLRRIRRYTAFLSSIGAAIMILIGVFLLLGMFSNS